MTRQAASFQDKRLLTRAEAAEYVGIAPEAFDALVADGQMPPSLPVEDVTLWDRKVIDKYRGMAIDLGPEQTVYVVGFTLYVKIGWTGNFANRFQQIQRGIPEQLIVHALLTGDRDLEWSLHQRFEVYRMQGEWFRLEDKLAEWIEKGCQL